MSKEKKDVIGAVCFIAIFAAFFLMGYEFPDNVRTYPWIICGIGLLFCLIFLAKSVRALSVARAAGTETPSGGGMLTIIITIVSTVAYVMLSEVIGYFVMTFIFIVAFSYWLDSTQNKLLYPAVALVFNVLLYFAFAEFLNVSLPHGMLF